MNYLKTISALFVVLTFYGSALIAQTQNDHDQHQDYSLVTYNVENLFDADGLAEYSDYLPTNREGAPQYTPAHVLTKIKHVVQVMQAYENGLGPDILTLVELESDFSPNDHGFVDPADFLGQYAYTTIDRMLGEEFNTDVAKLPSEWLLLKAFQDAGVGPYELEVGEPPLGDDGKPSSVQKNVVYSKFPILSERTKLHETERARPILEVWIDIEGIDLAVFVNHWKSGAGSASMEEIRVQNAQVLAKRIQELASEMQTYDIVLAGDFNSDYNQKTRYSFSTTGLQDVLDVKGDEALMLETARQGTLDWYNLWYEWPLEKRGSDIYRGYWGTLMQIIVSNTLYDNQGLSYVDQSFRVDDFGFNTYSGSGTPKRWSFYGQGTGYSDHLPLSIRLKKATDYFQGPFSVNDDDEWEAIPVRYNRPTERYGIEAFTTGEAWTEPEFYDTYFELEASLAEDGDVIVEGQKIDVYAPSFNFTQKAKEWLKQHSSQIRMVEFASRENQMETIRALDIRFIGRWSQYRGNWQFVVESESFVEILEE